jgi:O-methyltransferase
VDVTRSFEDQLVARTLQRILDGDVRQVALLGFTTATLAVRAALTEAGIGDRIVGMFDLLPPSNTNVKEIGLLSELPHELIVVGEDGGKEELLRAYRDHVGERAEPPEVVIAGTAHLQYVNEDFARLNAPALVPSYATGSPHTREHLFQCLQAAAANGLRGAIVEFGAFKGGTIAWLARVATDLGLGDCQVIGLDSWAGFPPRRSVLDLYEHPRCVFTDLDAVRAYTEPLGVKLIVGDITETYKQLEGMPLLLCFFDTDNYSPALAALELCASQLVAGGSIVFDHVATLPDFIDTIGERMAAYEVLGPLGFLHLHGTGVFTKIV